MSGLTSPGSPVVAPRLLGPVLSALDYAVLERTSDGNFHLCAEPRSWFWLVFAPDGEQSPIRLAGRSPFLDHFLADAQMFWLARSRGRLSSGTWIETDAAGVSWTFEAHASTDDHGDLLIIQEVGERYQEQQRVLQKAREHLLAEERLEREVMRRTAAIRKREQEIAIRLLEAAGTRDGETGGHVRRIGLYAAAMGEALGWEPLRIEDIRIAAPMHDIGKIGIPDAILRKPGRLTSEEFRIMQQHTVIGARLLGGSDIPLLHTASEIALCHHEKWNGTGYPDNLKGAKIPITARIVAIVDVYDAMISRRIYKAPIPEGDVLNTMRRAAGEDFDPELFDVFESALDAIREIRNHVPG
jgi:HD-GYP domain-containing protein (c-di-GMP phosphodiesterase class II)